MALMPPPVTLLILGWVALAKGWGVRRVHNKIHMLSNSTVFGKSHRPYLVLSVLDDDEAEGETGLPVQNTARYQCVFFTSGRYFYSSTKFGHLRLHVPASKKF